MNRRSNLSNTEVETLVLLALAVGLALEAQREVGTEVRLTHHLPTLTRLAVRLDRLHSAIGTELSIEAVCQEISGDVAAGASEKDVCARAERLMEMACERDAVACGGGW